MTVVANEGTEETRARPWGLQAITKDWALILNWLEGTSLAAQWLGCHASTAGGIGSTPGHGTKILHATQSKNKNTHVYLWRIHFDTWQN